MRQKKAKAIRAAAKQVTIGKPSVQYNDYQPPIYGPEDSEAEFPRIVKLSPGVPRTLNRDCTRAMYKRLKKALK